MISVEEEKRDVLENLEFPLTKEKGLVVYVYKEAYEGLFLRKRARDD